MPRSRAPVVAALATLYVVWSSTYLAMRIAARTLPPMTLGAVRFLVAGAVLYGVLRLRGAPRPSGVQWRAGALAGTLLLVGGLGGAASVATRVPSGLVALMFGSVPIWVTVLDRIVPQRGGASAGPLARAHIAALAVGTMGLVLVGLRGGLAADPGATVILAGASLSYAGGCVVARRAPLAPGSMAAATEMLAGGAVMAALAALRGERLAAVPPAAAFAAMAHLVVMGSIVAYSAFAYVVRVTPPAVATSYAYVNPVLALVVGVVFGGERIGWAEVVGVLLVSGAVFMMLRARVRPRAASFVEPSASPAPRAARAA